MIPFDPSTRPVPAACAWPYPIVVLISTTPVLCELVAAVGWEVLDRVPLSPSPCGAYAPPYPPHCPPPYRDHGSCCWVCDDAATVLPSSAARTAANVPAATRGASAAEVIARVRERFMVAPCGCARHRMSVADLGGRSAPAGRPL